MTPLPIDPILPELVERLRTDRAAVLVAPPGSGKTTRVAPAMVKAGILSRENPGVILLQPRRVATRAAAARIAEENGWNVGEEVGYLIRMERRVGPRTRIKVETEGILTRQLLADPFLEGVGAVILDEFHERSIHTDLALALLKEVKESVREDLMILVMSATLDAAPVARFLGDCPIIRAEGRTFPVDVRYRPTIKPASAEAIEAAVDEAIQGSQDRGHILVFLPGVEEIRRAATRLGSLASREQFHVLPLHGSLPGEEQDRVLRPSELRKVILATNIAETSLTIDGVTTVIDSGLARVASDDPVKGLDRLELKRISRASADQRAGRAGRTAPGTCIRLWSEREHRGLDDSDLPEVARVDLASTVLALHAWGAPDPRAFGWFEAPPAARLDAAERLLGRLGALDQNKKLTTLGRTLLDMPTHPRIARLLFAASDEGHIRDGAALAALLSEKDIRIPDHADRGAGFVSPARSGGRDTSDLLVRLELLHEAEARRFSLALRERGIDPIAARNVARTRDELARLARRVFGGADGQVEAEEEQMLRWLLEAYPDRVVRRRGNEVTGVMVGGRGVRLEKGSVVKDGDYFLALDPREDRRGAGAALEAKVRLASMVRAEWLEELFPEAIRRERSVQFDEERQAVVGVSSLWYLDLLLKEDRNVRVEPSEAAGALAEALKGRALEVIRADDQATGWLDRLSFLRRAQPEADWPALEEDESVLREVLEDACAGKRTLDDVRKTPFTPLLRARLPHQQARLMEELAPEAITVPSGSRIRLTYEPGRAPVLAVRIQELYGLTQTPRVAGGRVRVLLHLLGPNYRPVQVTDDLESFWSNTYFQVRKDLRARYPRHSWPDDPVNARPEAKGGRRN